MLAGGLEVSSLFKYGEDWNAQSIDRIFRIPAGGIGSQNARFLPEVMWNEDRATSRCSRDGMYGK